MSAVPPRRLPPGVALQDRLLHSTECERDYRNQRAVIR